MNNRFPDIPPDPDTKVFVNSPSDELPTRPRTIGLQDEVEDSGNMGRSPFRSTYLSGLNLSGLRLTTISRLLLDHSQLLREDGKGLNLSGLGHGFMAGIAILASGLTLLPPPWIQALDYEVQTFFFQRRGRVPPPEDIVILEIDETSLTQGEFYSNDPNTYANFAPLQQWPWRRQAYAIAIDRVMTAGAKAVAIDLILDRPSVWGDEDDNFLQYALERYPGQIVLASSFDDSKNDSGETLQLALPLDRLLDAGGKPGIINYPFAPNDRIHQFSQVWLKGIADADIAIQTHMKGLPESWTQTFVEQTVLATQQTNTSAVDLLQLKGEQIFFYGPARTFKHEAFWSILDPQNWQVHQRQNTFRDKIVLIGPTAELFQDEHRTPFGFMSGVEIHANAIATYLDKKAVTEAWPYPYLKALLVLGLTALAGFSISRPHRSGHRSLLAMALVIIWAVCSYLTWAIGHWILPTALPLGAIALGGSGYVMTELLQEKLRKLKLRSALKQYVSSPIVQDIISKQDDLQDLISEKEKETLGKILDGRYKVVKILGSGGFGQTFIAQDLRRPGQPCCVVKQLQPASNNPHVFHHLSQRLFTQEAETLERLDHNQIPKLLAYFEEAQEFYLVQELIEGHPLRYELLSKPSSELKVILIVKELLTILDFIHEQGVIHRDIKPSNIIRRHSDQRLVLIDFGAVKEIRGPAVGEEKPQNKTVSIGTRGYIPNEQLAGEPRFNSDIYAVGIIGIQASTGRSPDQLIEYDPKTGELIWQKWSEHSEDLKAILDKMIRYDFTQRYQLTQDVLQDLQPLLDKHITDSEKLEAELAPSYMPLQYTQNISFGDETVEVTDDFAASTIPWPTDMREDLDG